MKDYAPPFYAIDMPLDKDGGGPADADKTVRVVWQVWDQLLDVVCECPDEFVSKRISDLLNSHGL